MWKSVPWLLWVFMAFVSAWAAEEGKAPSAVEAGNAGPAKTDHGTPGDAASLERALRAYHQGMTSDVSGEPEKALRAMLPVKEDVQALFPDGAERLWKKMGPGLEKYASLWRVMAMAQKNRGPLGQVDLINLRTEADPRGLHKDLFVLLPKDVPVYRAVMHHGSSAIQEGPYVFVRGRWVCMYDLEEVPRTLAQTK